MLICVSSVCSTNSSDFIGIFSARARPPLALASTGYPCTHRTPHPRVQTQHSLAESELARHADRATRVDRQIGRFDHDATVSLRVLPGGLELEGGRLRREPMHDSHHIPRALALRLQGMAWRMVRGEKQCNQRPLQSARCGHQAVPY